MKKNVLVVGGAGYIGGSVTDYLIKKKVPFTVYDNLTYENHYLKKVQFIYGDIRERSKLKKILSQYTHIIWLAAIVGDNACRISPKATKDINEKSVEWLVKNFKGKIIFSSTCSVYGASNVPVNEFSDTSPLSLYAQTKLNAEKKLIKHKNALILRLGTAFGVSDAYSRIRLDLAVNIMTANAIINKKLLLYGGDQWRPFVHVKDIARVIVNSLDSKETGIFNIATQNLTIQKVAQIVKKYTDCKIVKIKNKKFLDARDYRVDISKAIKRKVLNGKFLTVEDGVNEIIDLIKQKRVKDIELPNYSNEKFLKSFFLNK